MSQSKDLTAPAVEELLAVILESVHKGLLGTGLYYGSLEKILQVARRYLTEARESSGSNNEHVLVAIQCLEFALPGVNSLYKEWQRLSTIDPSHAGRRVAWARHLVGWTQVDLARKLGKSQGRISHFENGRTRATPEFVNTVVAILEAERPGIWEETMAKFRADVPS